MTPGVHPSCPRSRAGQNSSIRPKKSGKAGRQMTSRPAKCTISLLSVTLHVPTKESWCTARVNGRPRAGVLCTGQCVSWVNTASNGSVASSVSSGATHAVQDWRDKSSRPSRAPLVRVTVTVSAAQPQRFRITSHHWRSGFFTYVTPPQQLPL